MITQARQDRALIVLGLMPHYEKEILTKDDPEKIVLETELYMNCQVTGNKRAWDKLKLFRQKAIIK